MDDLKVRLKSTVLIYQICSTSVVLRYCSEMINIDDEKGDITFFFTLLDGSLTFAAILSAFAEKYPGDNGGLDIRRAVFYSVIPGKSGCTECWKNSLPADKKTIIDEDNKTGNDYSAPAPALSALVSVTTGVMICETIKLLTGIQPPSLINNLKSFSFDDLSVSTTERWEQSPSCPYCNHNLK